MISRTRFSDALFGPALRRLPDSTRSLYLTFDDGPCPATTPQVLDLLAKFEAQATFFLIARQAQAHRGLVERLQRAGHTLGNHSLDHAYAHYFHGAASLKRWIEDAEKLLQDLSGAATVGFRPPAGIRTPPFRRVMRELREPVILWSMRYYDAVRPWRKSDAERSLPQLTAGDIILLHDRQKPSNQTLFLETLEYFLKTARTQNFQLRALPDVRHSFFGP